MTEPKDAYSEAVVALLNALDKGGIPSNDTFEIVRALTVFVHAICGERERILRGEDL